MAYEAVIGLECHVELSTATKMFCSCANVFGAPPNTQTCPVCLGHPGTLPVPNREAIARIIKIGLALDSAIAPHSLYQHENPTRTVATRTTAQGMPHPQPVKRPQPANARRHLHPARFRPV